MNAIAAEAGITKPILYRWFGDKEGLYGQLAERHTGVLLSHLRAAWDGQGDRAARTAALVRAYLEFAESSPEVYLFLVAAQDSAPEAALTTRLSDLLGEALAPELGLAGPSALTRTWATAMVGALQAATARWLRMRDLDRDALADQLSALLCHGARPETL
jgi:AcrR family transcriptional regulator